MTRTLTSLSILVLVALLATPAFAGTAANNPPTTGGGGGAVSSVTAGVGGCVTIAPTTGAVIVDSSGCAGGGVTSAVAGTGVAVSAATGAVTFSLAPIATQRILGNVSGTPAAPAALTQAQAATFLGSSFLIPGNNLSDIGSASTARTNLGLGTAALQINSFFLQSANNLSDLVSASAARTNLGLGTAAVQNVGAFAQTANNLSDLGSAATARTNLGINGTSQIWLNARRNAAAAVNSTLNSEWYSDLGDSSWGSVAGSGTVAASSTLGGGVVVVTGQNGASAQLVPAGHPPLVGDASTQPFYAYWRARFVGPTGANAQMLLVVIDSSSLGQQLSIGVDGTFQTGGSNSFFVQSVFNGSTRTTTAGTLALDTASYHDVEETSDGTTVTAKIDGTTIGTMAASSWGTAGPATIGVSNFSNDATGRVTNVDKMYMAFVGQ
jgi:hypothetical protein